MKIGIALIALLIILIALSNASQQVHTSSSVAIPTTIATISPHSSHSSNLDYRALARQDAIAAGISPDIFERQMNEESGFNPRAVSPAGAIGIAQFMPTTAQGLGVNPWNPIASLRAAARLMASYVHHYDGSYAMALAAYNAGSGAVAYAVAQGGSQWQAWLPAETRNYILVILGGPA